MSERQSTSPVRTAMHWSLAVGLLMLVLKIGAYVLTGSAAILGDAAESVVHVVAVAFAAFSVWLAEQPADANHPYGHSKIAFFSAGVEGALIVIAAGYIVFECVRRWLGGHVIHHLGEGLLLTVLTIVINAALGFYLVRTGRRHHSLIITANGRHVLTDGWTSLGAVAGLVLTKFTGQTWWDPLCGLIIAGNVLVSGYWLLRQSVTGLMDEADPGLAADLEKVLVRETGARGVSFHALRHRNAGHVHYADVHFLFPDEMLLKDAHRLATEIERAVEQSLPKRVHITTHLECAGDHDEIHPGGER
jgi:cation diffusion facilitator family transporter